VRPESANPATGDRGARQGIQRRSGKNGPCNRAIAKASQEDRKGISVAVYDGTMLTGTIVERSDGAGFDALDANGKYFGTFASRLAASRAIPTGAER
jgi:hypothetical protein